MALSPLTKIGIGVGLGIATLQYGQETHDTYFLPVQRELIGVTADERKAIHTCAADYVVSREAVAKNPYAVTDGFPDSCAAKSTLAALVKLGLVDEEASDPKKSGAFTEDGRLVEIVDAQTVKTFTVKANVLFDKSSNGPGGFDLGTAPKGLLKAGGKILLEGGVGGVVGSAAGFVLGKIEEGEDGEEGFFDRAANSLAGARKGKKKKFGKLKDMDKE